MTIACLVSGRLVTVPEQRTSGSGRPFVMTRIAVTGDERPTFVTVFAFGATARRVLLALGIGANVTCSGTVRASVWKDKHGEAHAQLALTADQVLTLHEAARVTRAVRDARQDAAPAPPPQASGRTDAQRATRKAAALWQGTPGASGFDDMPDDVPF